MGVFSKDGELVVPGPYRFDQTALFLAATKWTVLGNDTVNLAANAGHILGTGSLLFDKTDGLANTKLAGMSRTVSWDLVGVGPKDHIVGCFYIPNTAAVNYAFVRIGTSAGHLHEWRYPDTSMTTASWNMFDIAVGSPTSQTGNGVDWSAVAYLCVGVAFDAETDALANMLWNNIGIEQAALTRT